MEWRSLCDGAPWSSSLWHLCSNHWVDFIMKPLTTFSFVPTITAALEYHFVWFVENYYCKFNNAEHSHLSGYWLAGHKSEETNFNPFKFRFFFWNQYVYSCCLCVITLRWQLALHERITILLPTVPSTTHNVYSASQTPQCLLCHPQKKMLRDSFTFTWWHEILLCKRLETYTY